MTEQKKKPDTLNKVPSLKHHKEGNLYVTMNNPDDSLTKQTGDNASLISLDNPDDSLEE
ncbi:hypothetical protein Tfer_1037 [Thermincola ferriacetica]|uniref:Uncharacterized protein n=2 Tax=Thermincola TaxID=278993 RepID=D5X7Y1_THEPJ|nr:MULTISPECIES: hypothetical protein [Thermincola]ADG82701.1 hypothetical protein TherJR_1852 [Thermincola potens JR]KNZ70167.1 hypothetical protein Tfer_1037 [Thermincola ferriacetica]